MKTFKKLKSKIHQLHIFFEDIIIKYYVNKLQKKYKGKCFGGAIGVGVYKNGDYYLYGSIPGFVINKNKPFPGATARHIAKGSLQIQLGPLPPNMGIPHQLKLIKLPSFYLRLESGKRREFIDQWKRLIISYDLPYCEFK